MVLELSSSCECHTLLCTQTSILEQLGCRMGGNERKEGEGGRGGGGEEEKREREKGEERKEMFGEKRGAGDPCCSNVSHH